MGLLQSVQASKALVNESQGLYRINQPAVNNGDIFRLDQSFRTVVVGPQSDFAEYTLYYYDPVRDLRVNLAAVTSDQPWIGRLDARLTDLFVGTLLPGALYIVPKDLYIPQQLPLSGITDTGRVTTFAPNIDILCYQQDPGAIPDKRPSKTIRTTVITDPIKTRENLVNIPVYGRRHWDLTVIDNFLSGGNEQLDIRVRGIRFSYPIGAATLGNQNALLAFLSESNAPPVQVGLSYDSDMEEAISNQGAEGYFDYIQVGIIAEQVGVPPNPFTGIKLLFDTRD
jgi:hypothetical protein